MLGNNWFFASVANGSMLLVVILIAVDLVIPLIKVEL